MRPSKFLFPAAALAALSLGGCYERVVERPVPVAAAPASTSVYVEQPPPPEIVETLPPQPGPDFVWHPGHYVWNGAAYVWQGGRWVRRERPGVWVPAHWEHRAGGWVFVEGYYR